MGKEIKEIKEDKLFINMARGAPCRQFQEHARAPGENKLQRRQIDMSLFNDGEGFIGRHYSILLQSTKLNNSLAPPWGRPPEHVE